MLCIKLKFFSSSLIFFVWTSRCVLAGPGNCDSVSLSVILTYYNTLSVCYVSTPLFYPILKYYMIWMDSTVERDNISSLFFYLFSGLNVQPPQAGGLHEAVGVLVQEVPCVSLQQEGTELLWRVSLSGRVLSDRKARSQNTVLLIPKPTYSS